MTDALTYLVYGPEIYAQEATYSLLSAFAHAPPGDGTIRYVVYTDRPEAFAPLNIDVVVLDGGMKERWLAGDNYIHRLKMCAHRHALRQLDGRVAFVDTDTFFRESPLRLIRRIRPGCSVLHVAEGRLSEVGTTDFEIIRKIVATHPLLGPSGEPVAIAADEMMWNSGVVGLHTADISLLDASIGMVDQLRRIPAARAVNQLEQFVTGVQLSRHTRVSEAVDLVYHYWFHDVKAQFRSRLPELLTTTQQPDLRRWGKALRADHPSTSFLRRLKMHVRTAARRAGLAVPGARASA